MIMQLAAHKALTRRGYLHRGLVALLLALILTDLMLPQLCCDELGCSSETGAEASATSAADDAVLVAASDSQGEQQHSEQPAAEKGCFCCCARILQSQRFVADIALVNVEPSDPEICILPSSPPSETFHPPRLS